MEAIYSFIDAWSRFVTKRRWLVIISTLAGIMLLLVPTRNLYFDNSNEMWFLSGDPALVRYEKLRDLFGSSQYLVVGIEAREGEETVITKENLELIARIHRFLEDHEYVLKVSSLINYQYITSENDILTTHDLVEDVESLESNSPDLQKMVDIMAEETLVHNYLISDDLKHTVVMAKTLYKKSEIDHQVQLIQDLETFLAELNPAEKGYTIRLAGSPVISENFLTTSVRDISTTLPIMFLLTLAFLWFAFRRISAVLMPLTVIIASVISVLGLLGLFNWAVNSLNINLPVLLIAIGIGDSVHIIVEFYHGIDEKMDPLTASRQAVRNLFIPCFNTSLTTSLGFLAVSATSLRPLREFGIIAAIGVFLAFIISVTTLPALLTFFHPKPNSSRKKIHEGFIAQLTNRITPFAEKNSRMIIIVSVIIAAVSYWYASGIRVDTNFINNFKESSRIRRDMRYFDETYRGGYNLEFIVDSGEEGGAKDPAFLKRVYRFQNYLESLEQTGKANSMINYLNKMHKVMNNDNEAYSRVPENRDLVAQLLFLYRMSSPEEDLTDLISFDERYLRISVRVKNMPTSKMQDLVDIINDTLQREFPGLDTYLAGDTNLWNNMSVYIQEGIVKSFSIAFFTIIVCFFVLLRSFRYGLLAVIPSLSPILVAGGLMGYLGIYLDFSTMMVAAICFGIAVDDTIHVMTRYTNARRGGESRRKAVNRAVTESGRAVTFTSLILYCGFSITMLSSFMPNVYFGMFSGIILIIALVTNLLLLPAIILTKGDSISPDTEQS